MDMLNREDKRYEDEEYYNYIIGQRNNNDVNSLYTMEDAVFSGCFLNTCLRNCDIVQMACFSPIVNTRGAIFTHKDGIVLRPQYFVFKLYTSLLKDTVLNIWKEDVPTITGTRNGQELTVDVVDAVVTYGDGTYAIAAINKDAVNCQSFDLSVLDDTLTEIRIHTVNGPATNSYNDIDRTEVGITVSDWMPFTGSVTLAPHSVNVIEMR